MNYLQKISAMLLVAFACFILFTAATFAQQITATVTGTVSDPAGAVIPGATVTITSIDTGLVKNTTTGDNGNYTIPFLAPGSYNIAVSKTGFETINKENITLEVAQTAGIDLTLGVSGGQVTVDVNSNETPLLQSETSQLETTIEQKLVEDLPSVERNIFSFVNLVPGTIDTNIALGNSGSQVGSSANRNFFDSNFAINGGRASTNDVLLDGVTNTIGDFNGVTISPPQDAIREFKVVSGVAPADYGRTGGGIVTISSKAGTKRFHGSLYEYFQDGNLFANGFFRNKNNQPRINDVSRHQFGGAIGGPLLFPSFGEGTPSAIKKFEKTFFFFNYELRREKNPFTRELTLPTAKMRTGDLSELLGGARNGFTNPNGSTALFGQIYNPYGALVGGLRQPFANNDLSVLPVCPSSGPRASACLDPVALAVLQYLPLPNRDGLVNNFLFSGTTDFTRDIVAARIDHTISERQNFFVRFSYEKRNSLPTNYFNSAATSVANVKDRFYNTTINHVYSLTPTLINNARYGFTRAAAQQGPNSFGFDPATLGLPAYLSANAPVFVFPTFTIGGGAQGLTAAGEITSGQIGGSGNDQARDTHNLSDSLTYITGKHNVRFGGEYRLYRFYPFQFLTPTGSFSFNRFATRGPNPTNSPSQVEATGSSLASFLLGIPSGISQEVVQPLTIYHHYGAAFVQDDYKFLNNLTLNLGLRWDFETPTANNQQLITNFDFNAAAPLRGRLNLTNLDPAVAQLNPNISNLSGLLDFPEGAQIKTNYNRFAPRVGFAYGYNNKTTLRGGFGVFYLPISLESVTAVGTNFTNTQNQTSFTTGTNPQVNSQTVFLSNPFPNGLQGPIGNSQGALTQLGNSITIVEPKRPNSYSMSYNLVLQRELAKNLVVDIAYVGSYGKNLPARDINLNQLSKDALDYARANFNQPNTCGTTACTSVATFLARPVTNPFAGLIPGTPLNTATIPRAQLLRRFPQYQTVTYSRPLIGKSNYNALQVNLAKRFSDGWSALANYTFSKSLDTGGVGNGASFTDPTNAADAFDFDGEYSYSTLDVPHRVTGSFSYELPFGKGKRFGKESSGFTNFLISGWQVSGTGVYQKGAPLTITYSPFLGGGSALTTVGASQRRPNRVAGVDPRFNNLGELVRNGQSIFNPDAFSAPSDTNFEFGNASRTYNDIRRDSYKNVDLSIIKNIYFGDSRERKLQLRGEFLNAFNTVVFGTPGTQFGSTTFGLITSQGNRPRIIQLVGRFTF